MVAARRMVRRHFGLGHQPVHRALAQVLATIVWPPAVLVHIWEIRRSRGPKAVPIQRVPGAIWAAMRHNVLPGEYYAYALWLPDRRANIDNYLYAKEGPQLFKLLNRPLEPNPVDDKLAFYDLCKAHALPSPEILAVFTSTGKSMEFKSGQPPTRDLFVKPRTGSGGEGAERFRWEGVAFESNRGVRLCIEELDGYLATRARTENRTLLVQPALSNHPELHLDANASLATARLVTGLSTDGDVSAIVGFIYFAETDQIPARHSQVALIDVASGQLVSAPCKLSGTNQSCHPLDNGSHDAQVLPDWDTVLRHTKVAHRACPNFVFLGWDVAFTEQGPMLLEGNVNWCADEYQRLQGKPLGYTRFLDILAAHLSGLKTGEPTI